MPLKPLHDAGRLRRVIATCYQAVSGAGVNGIADLREQTLAWARGEAMTPRHFEHRIAFTSSRRSTSSGRTATRARR